MSFALFAAEVRWQVGQQVTCGSKLIPGHIVMTGQLTLVDIISPSEKMVSVMGH